MIKPKTLIRRPTIFLVLLGAAAATILLSALIYLGPLLGFPLVDVPLLWGGVFTNQPTVALWLGFWIFFLPGAFIFPVIFRQVWPNLPGPDTGMVGGLIKGLLWGAALFVLSGVLFPVIGALNQLPANVVARPGWFALDLGAMATLGVLLGHLAYGASQGLIAGMGQGIELLDTFGWEGTRYAEVPEGALMIEEHRARPEKTT
jgi:hypothetical protein